MIEKNFERKITAYLNGALSKHENSEFEAAMRTNSDLMSKVQSKEDEINQMKGLIPAIQISKESQESLESEMKTSIFNLLKEEPRNLKDKLKSSLEEWFNR